MYCTENSEIFYLLVSEFDGNDASCVGLLQEVFKDSNEMKVLNGLGLHSCKIQFSVTVYYNKVRN